MSKAQLLASRALWRRREVYRKKKVLSAKTSTARARWQKLWQTAYRTRIRRDKQIAALTTKTVSFAGAGMVAEFEGFSQKVYRDTGGVETIGYGETRKDIIERYRHTGITQAQALVLLRTRLTEFAQGVLKLCKNKPTQSELDALTSFAYNVGLGAFAQSTLLKFHNAGAPRAAADQFMRWDKVNGRVLLGLKRRRARERSLYLR